MNQNEVQQAVEKIITDAAKKWQPVSLSEQLKTEQERARRKHRDRQQALDELKGELTWTCEFCGVVHSPQKVNHPFSGYTWRKVDFCGCDGSVVNQAEVEQRRIESEKKRHTEWLTEQLIWREFDTEWPETEVARQQLRYAREQVFNWYVSPQGNGLVLSGNYGCGKTHLLRAVVRAYGFQGHQVAFYNEPDIVASLTNDERLYQIQRHCRTAKVVILDDVGARRFNASSEWLKHALQAFYFRVLEHRNAKGFFTLASTNCRFAEFPDKIGGRALDRLQHIVGSKERWVGMWDVPSYRVRDF